MQGREEATLKCVWPLALQGSVSLGSVINTACTPHSQVVVFQLLVKG